jgi:ATP-dependent helicase/nuclease subunit A
MSEQVRAAAIDPAGSYLVQAPAGSGKTELLTRRILKLLSVVDEPEEILALTFTRKAAAEMRGRVVGALTMEKPDEPDSHRVETWRLACAANARSEVRGWHLAEHPSRLRMMTLDSFTHALARQLPLLSGMGEMPIPSDDVTPLYREAAETAIAGLLKRAPEAAASVLLHQDHNVPALVELLAGMLGKRDQWLREVELHSADPVALRGVLEQGLEAIMQQRLTRCADMLPSEAKAELPALIAFAAGNRGDVELAALLAWPEGELAQLSAWQRLAGELMTDKGLRKPGGINATRGFPAGKEFAPQKQAFQDWLGRLSGIDGMEAALAGLRALPAEPRFDDGQWQVLEGQLSLLLSANRCLERLFAERGVADYTEISMRAMRALEDEYGNPTDLLLRLDYRIHHILVDEFQDTSLLQMRLLRNLTEGWQAGDGTHRTLFMVGDPMQSIYRFRKAEVGLFLLAAANRAGLPQVEPLQLERNFRSAPRIVDWVNRAFSTIFPEEDILMAAVAHAPAEAALSHDGEVRLNLQQGKDAVAEAAAVLTTVQRELADEGRRVGILARSRKHLHAIMQALGDAGVAFRAVDILPLGERPEIRLLRALLRALLHPADRASWAALLRAPWCGLDTAALHSLLAGDARNVLEILNDDACTSRLDGNARERMRHVCRALEPSLALAGRVAARPLVENAWKRLGMPGLLGETQARNTESMFDLIEEIDEGGLIDFTLLDDRLEKLYAAPDTSATARVELLTMHGAKGLQWDVVILPGLGYGNRQGDTPLLAFTDVPLDQGEVCPLIAVKGAVRSSDAVYDLVRSIEKVRENNELARLIYVACTRAESALYMFGHVSENSGEATKGSLLELLLPEGADGGCFGAEVNWLTAAQTGGEEHAGRRLTRVVRLPEIVAISEDEVLQSESEYFWAGAEAAPAGMAVHAALQRIAGKGIEHWKPADTEVEAGRMHRMLLAEGLAGDVLQAALDRSLAALERVLGSQRGRWLLSGGHEDAHCEWMLSSRREGQVSHHVIDRSFVDADGVRWIVDYKTASHEGGRLDEFLAEELRRHAQQLSRYAALLAAMEPGRQVRTALYFPVLDAWIECPGEVSPA